MTNRLHSFFNASARSLAILATSALFSLTGSVQASNESAPAQKDVIEMPASATTWLDTADNHQLMTVEALKEEFGRTKLGEKLLFFAEENGINIVFNETELDSLGVAGLYTDNPNIVWIKPSLDDNYKLYVLAHELFHGRQDHVMYINKMENRFLTPAQQWAIRQFGEAEGVAFGAFYLADRAFNLKVALPDIDGHPAYLIASLLFSEMHSPDKVTPAEYRELGFRFAFNNLQAYNKPLREAIQKDTKVVADDMRRLDSLMKAGGDVQALVDKYDSLFKKTPTDAEFEKYLRRFGSMTLRDDTPTAFGDTAVTYKQLMEDYPRAVSGNLFMLASMRSALNDFISKENDVYAEARAKVERAKMAQSAPLDKIRVKQPPRVTLN